MHASISDMLCNAHKCCHKLKLLYLKGVSVSYLLDLLLVHVLLLWLWLVLWCCCGCAVLGLHAIAKGVLCLVCMLFPA